MRVSDGTVVGRLTSGDGACAHDLVQGTPLSLVDGFSIIPEWSDQPGVEIVCNVAPGLRVSMNGERRTGMFVLRPGQAFSLRAGRAGETADQTWTLLRADQVPVTADSPDDDPAAAKSRCAFCHRTLRREGVVIDVAGLPPRWQALVDGPLCKKCASGVTEACRPASERSTP
jgi:hypothetical protein